MSPVRRNNKNKGGGIINTLINKLPFELHLPGDYKQYISLNTFNKYFKHHV